jgi:hypothetical protein
MNAFLRAIAISLLIFPAVNFARAAEPPQPCRIEVVERGSGWPVPLVELRTLHKIRFVTDNAGVIAFDLPELLGRPTWFDVIGQGYSVPKDGFGERGVRLTPEPGKTLKVEVDRDIIAKCLGRVTGAGLFAESQKTGRDLDWAESGVLGSDSVQNAVYQGRLFWLWGDTTLANYPLGIFDSSSATSLIHPIASFEPPLKIKLDYFTGKNGLPRGVAKMPGNGPTWISGYVVLPDAQEKQRLVASYVKIRSHLEVYETGLCVWNDATSNFDKLRQLWTKTDPTQKPPSFPSGHAAFWKDAGGTNWALFGDPLPTLRCPANLKSWENSSTWEILKPQKTLLSAADGKPVTLHSGSLAWNSWRKRWVIIFMQAHGDSSDLGEIWYAEATSPFGPWGKAVKVLSHNNYTFYNPEIHPEFTAADSPILIFEGTYTQEFANHPEPTPRYDYNQIMYRLDLDDPRIAPAHNQ